MYFNHRWYASRRYVVYGVIDTGIVRSLLLLLSLLPGFVFLLSAIPKYWNDAISLVDFGAVLFAVTAISCVVLIVWVLLLDAISSRIAQLRYYRLIIDKRSFSYVLFGEALLKATSLTQRDAINGYFDSAQFMDKLVRKNKGKLDFTDGSVMKMFNDHRSKSQSIARREAPDLYAHQHELVDMMISQQFNKSNQTRKRKLEKKIAFVNEMQRTGDAQLESLHAELRGLENAYEEATAGLMME